MFKDLFYYENRLITCKQAYQYSEYLYESYKKGGGLSC